MSKLKKCLDCSIYTLKETCSKCKNKTQEAHYKFIKIRDAPTDSKNNVSQ